MILSLTIYPSTQNESVAESQLNSRTVEFKYRDPGFKSWPVLIENSKCFNLVVNGGNAIKDAELIVFESIKCIRGMLKKCNTSVFEDIQRTGSWNRGEGPSKSVLNFCYLNTRQKIKPKWVPTLKKQLLQSAKGNPIKQTR